MQAQFVNQARAMQILGVDQRSLLSAIDRGKLKPVIVLGANRREFRVFRVGEVNRYANTIQRARKARRCI